MSGIAQVLKYVNYRLGAKSPHSLHSPFVYQLVSDAFKKPKDNRAIKHIEELRQQLSANDSVIEVIDLGAGSKINASNQRSIAEITRNSSVKPKYGRLLHRLALHFKPNTILELGTSLGFATMYLAAGATAAKVCTIEGSPETAKVARDNFNKLNMGNIRLEVGEFDEVLAKQSDQLDMVFFDGNHRKQPTLRYFVKCLEKSTEDSVFIFDDIHWSKEMEGAWREIKKHPRVTLTIDVFRMGLVFFREGQAKEDFVIRY